MAKEPKVTCLATGKGVRWVTFDLDWNAIRAMEKMLQKVDELQRFSPPLHKGDEIFFRLNKEVVVRITDAGVEYSYEDYFDADDTIDKLDTRTDENENFQKVGESWEPKKVNEGTLSYRPTDWGKAHREAVETEIARTEEQRRRQDEDFRRMREDIRDNEEVRLMQESTRKNLGIGDDVPIVFKLDSDLKGDKVSFTPGFGKECGGCDEVLQCQMDPGDDIIACSSKVVKGKPEYESKLEFGKKNYFPESEDD